MKIRSGFVSNSSSSSFLVMFKEENLEAALNAHYDEIFQTDKIESPIVKDFFDNARFVIVESLVSEDSEWEQSEMDELFEDWKDNVQIKKCRQEGYKHDIMYIPDYGEGGDKLQTLLKQSMQNFVSDSIYIKNLEDNV